MDVTIGTSDHKNFTNSKDMDFTGCQSSDSPLNGDEELGGGSATIDHVENNSLHIDKFSKCLWSVHPSSTAFSMLYSDKEMSNAAEGMGTFQLRGDKSVLIVKLEGKCAPSLAATAAHGSHVVVEDVKSEGSLYTESSAFLDNVIQVTTKSSIACGVFMPVNGKRPLGVPTSHLHEAGELIGVLQAINKINVDEKVGNGSTVAFSREDVFTLKAMCKIAASIISSSAQFMRAKELKMAINDGLEQQLCESKESTAESMRLFQDAMRFTSADNMLKLQNFIMKRGKEIFEAELCLVFLVPEIASILNSQAVKEGKEAASEFLGAFGDVGAATRIDRCKQFLSCWPEDASAPIKVPMHEGIVGTVAATGTTLLISDVEDSNFDDKLDSRESTNVSI